MSFSLKTSTTITTVVFVSFYWLMHYKNTLNDIFWKAVLNSYEKHKNIVFSLMSVVSWCCTCFCVVLCVSFCRGHFVMVPLNLTYLHCLQLSYLNISSIYICITRTLVFLNLFDFWFFFEIFLCGFINLYSKTKQTNTTHVNAYIDILLFSFVNIFSLNIFVLYLITGFKETRCGDTLLQSLVEFWGISSKPFCEAEPPFGNGTTPIPDAYMTTSPRRIVKFVWTISRALENRDSVVPHIWVQLHLYR